MRLTMNSHLLRKIAKSPKYQILYSRAKEIGGIQLFSNIYDFTLVQILFLQWLETYHSLYVDLAMKKAFISEEVIEDHLRTEAYLLYRNREKEDDKKRTPSATGEGDIPSVIFSKKM